MKIVICCPNCGTKELGFLTPTTTTVVKCTNDKCLKVFHVNESGYNTED